MLKNIYVQREGERERTVSHMNYAGVKCLFVTPSVLQTDRLRERDRQTETHRENELGHILITHVLCTYL